MHGNLSSCAESVFIAARRPRGVARERENGEERVASNPERQLNPCTRPRPFLHNTYVQPRRRLRTSPTPVAKGAKRVCVTAAFADDPLFSPPCLEKSFPNDRCDIFRGRKGRGGRTESERSVEGDRSTFLETESGTFLFFKEVSEPTRCTRLGNYSHGSLVPRRLDDEVREGRPTAYLPHRHVLNVREHKTNLKRWNGETKKRRDSKREDFFFRCVKSRKRELSRKKSKRKSTREREKAR